MEATSNKLFFKKFSHHLKDCLKNSLLIAKNIGHNQTQPTHILYALLKERGSIGGEFLNGLKLDPEKVLSILETGYKINLIDNLPEVEFSLESQELIKKTAKLAYKYKHQYIGTEHLLAAIIASEDNLVKKIISEFGLSTKELLRQSEIILKTSSKFPEIINTFKNNDNLQETTNDDIETSNILSYFCRNLTNTTTQKNIDPVIGREQEINRIIEVLCRRTKNNPLLLGDPGVGKTAIIEGLAKRITMGEVPDLLLNKKIYSLDLASVVAGTSFRGEFESRIKEIITEIEENKNIILFIDEIHQIVGAGSSSGSLDAANILKPALARGEIKIIGATTYSDYRKSIENDPALARRLQIIRVEEPDVESAKAILLGIKDHFENFHQIKIDDESIRVAIELSQRYLPEKFLPDKAIDLIDEAAANLKVNRKLSKNELQIKELVQQLNQLNQSLGQFIVEDKFNEALNIKTQIKQLQAKTNKLKLKLETNRQLKYPRVTPLDIAKVITKSTGIPATDLIKPEAKSIAKIEKELKTNIIGQTEALNLLKNYLKRAKAGLAPENRPLASFLFIGPSGVGKTHTAKILAKEFFSNEKSLVRIDMSEFGEKFNVSKLIGSPAGYVGYKESGQLTEQVKRNPHSLVLFDEIEKANREVFDLLLQILDEGYLTDAAGVKINFKNTIIIMTSNIGNEYWNGKNNIGFDDTTNNSIKQKINQEIKSIFKPEFLNRLDRIIYFNKLQENDLKKIAQKELNRVAKRIFDQKNIKLSYDDNLTDYIIKQIQNDNNQGARGINLVIRDQLETALADIIITNKHKYKNTLLAKAKNGIITLS